MFVLSDFMRRRILRHAFIGVLVTAFFLFLLSPHLEGIRWGWNIVFGPGPERGDPGPYYVAYPGNYSFVMDDTPACKDTTPFLLLVVPVAPGGRAARDAIRKTWGGEKQVLGRPVETLFLLGLPGGADAARQQEELRLESRQHRDLIQSDFLDSYHNLTIKTMMALEWASSRCPRASYVMKADSDVFVHLENLLQLLLDPGTATRDYVTGLVWRHSKVFRNPFNKFYMPRQVVPEPEYPPYPLGMSYIMSMDLPAKLLGASPHVKAVFIEDVYLGMCLRRLGISPTDPPQETQFLVDPWHPLSDCSLSKVIATNTRRTNQILVYWKRRREARCPNL